MTTEDRHHIEVRGLTVEVVRKDIKNLHLAVYPPLGRVRVAVPKRLNDEAVRLAVIGRLGWIRRQQASLIEQERQSRREMVTGESHYFRGRRLRLRVIERDGRPRVALAGNTTLELQVPPGADRAQREAILVGWYREQLRRLIPGLIAKWEPVIGVRVADWRIRRMRTRWGSCSAEAGRIWLNLELIKKSPACLEYIVIHEMVHLLERHHNERFSCLMDRWLPGWRMRRDELNRAPLGYEDWI